MLLAPSTCCIYYQSGTSSIIHHRHWLWEHHHLFTFLLYRKKKEQNIQCCLWILYVFPDIPSEEHHTVLDVLSEKLSAFCSWFGLEECIMYVRQYYNGVVVFCARRAPALTNKLTAKRRISFWINKLFTSFLMNPYGLEVRDLQCIIIMQSSPYVCSILIKLSWRQK